MSERNRSVDTGIGFLLFLILLTSCSIDYNVSRIAQSCAS